jgi:hypothetical protein
MYHYVYLRSNVNAGNQVYNLPLWYMCNLSELSLIHIHVYTYETVPLCPHTQ